MRQRATQARALFRISGVASASASTSANIASSSSAASVAAGIHTQTARRRNAHLLQHQKQQQHALSPDVAATSSAGLAANVPASMRGTASISRARAGLALQQRKTHQQQQVQNKERKEQEGTAKEGTSAEQPHSHDVVQHVAPAPSSSDSQGVARKTQGRTLSRSPSSKRARGSHSPSHFFDANPAVGGLRIQLLSPPSASINSTARRPTVSPSAKTAALFGVKPVRAPPASLGSVAWDSFFAQDRPLLTHGLLQPASVLTGPEAPGMENALMYSGGTANTSVARQLEEILEATQQNDANPATNNIDQLPSADDEVQLSVPGGAMFVLKPRSGAFLRHPDGQSQSASEEMIIGANELQEIQEQIQQLLPSAGSSSPLAVGDEASMDGSPHAIAVVQVDVDVESFGAKADAEGEQGPARAETSAAIAQAIEEIMQDVRKYIGQDSVAGANAGPRWKHRIEDVSTERFNELIDRLSAVRLSPVAAPLDVVAAEYRRLTSEAALVHEKQEAVAAALERGEDPALAQKLGAEAELLVLGERAVGTSSAQKTAGNGQGQEMGGRSKRMFYLGAALGGPGSGFGSIGRPDSRWARGTASWLVLKGRPFEVPPAPAAPVSSELLSPVKQEDVASGEEESKPSIELTASDLQYVSDVISSRTRRSQQQHHFDPNDANLVLSRAMVQNSLPAALQWDSVTRKMDAVVEGSNSREAGPAARPDEKGVIDVSLLNASLDEGSRHVDLDSVKRKRRKKMRKHKYKKLRKEQRSQRQRLKK
ncbi:hypothetical protein K437DRAFT_292307 [Tilletiaria anomala UBC 951]|uniref:Ribosomal protein mS38 C-terminal domain-containing protein n=1 Tax=Tilletiaria anomala (strain ATCC 24038 / CBS 436.72 / UBC 951) TaxID=1037660 RepID=A0A066WHW2_TILAU|nr:uncharacterized protein K437DRAFT_292307 [Tilletiaria anomala UBC 951]KDN53371.1 hypothetical protein K437DRAFT_292307 [Tilletiaria anomala UBC 951]